MGVIDWSIVGGYMAVSLAIGLMFTKKAGRSLKDYFLSGRSLPWWVVGGSMVATTFAADTPLAVTEYVRGEGIWRNWFWWTLAINHILAAVVFSRLWRRAEVLTDNELIELRYHGKPAAVLRALKACYFSTIYNFIVMGWVTAAMSTVLSEFIDIPITWAVVACMVIALIYSLMSGFWGVVVTDIFQFGVAMIGSVVFAVLAAKAAGGMDAMLAKIAEMGAGSKLAFFPSMSSGPDVWEFLVFVLVMWWSTHNADGGGYMIQRMMAAKNEKQAQAGTFFFALMHYIVRVWPWVVVALASVVLLPGSVTGRQAYPQLMANILPVGLRGVFVAVFLAAFMSTIDTHLNWGSSYIVNDIYKRFIKPEAEQKHYVAVSKIVSLVLMIVAGFVALEIHSITSAWELVWAMGAGVGAVLILRWFWWRINAYSEISAMATSLVIAIGIQIWELTTGESLALHIKALVVVLGSIAVWLPVTFLTKPEPEKVLKSFCERVKPGGRWPFEVAGRGYGRSMIVAWIGGVGIIYGGMFTIGALVLRQTDSLSWSIPLVTAGGALVWLGMRKILRQQQVKQ
ncbi:MAG TPA: sodium:solute symporter family protein [Myxococcota bacterium]|nr:sodium:solute symporter family protein [Myxococcota bacterium]